MSMVDPAADYLDVPITVRVSQRQALALETVAARRDISVAELIRQAIAMALGGV